MHLTPSANVTARDRTMQVAFDAYVGFATVSVNPLIFLVRFVFLKHISFCIYGSCSRLVHKAYLLLKSIGTVDLPFPLQIADIFLRSKLTPIEVICAIQNPR